MTPASLLSVHVGTIQPLGPKGIPSAFAKHRVEGAVAVGPLGLAGDEQAELSVHGGPDKAVYGYPAAHYAAWRDDYPEHGDLFVAGGVGENLTIAGWTEADLCVGDVHRMGSATLQVCQPRQPCFKFALRFGDKQAAQGDGAQRPRRLVLSRARAGQPEGGRCGHVHRSPASRASLRAADRDRQFPPADARRSESDGGDGRAGAASCARKRATTLAHFASPNSRS